MSRDLKFKALKIFEIQLLLTFKFYESKLHNVNFSYT
ncbi:hypothetical protein AAULR_26246 [Lacticaseibacillus rhamnosus MTCC 5462]|nr:hypothetical protein AAULR_26246 [Lacticaseibacillus rhamnosus MTCC 5462]